jgi:hypothetical protein
MRIARARSVRDDFGNEAEAARGALGISRRTRADWGKARRSAIRAPPPPMLSAVANSRNSLPLSSRLRTNTGIAKGRRSHFRSSRSALFWLKRATFPCGLDPCLLAHHGPNPRTPYQPLRHTLQNRVDSFNSTPETAFLGAKKPIFPFTYGISFGSKSLKSATSFS